MTLHTRPDHQDGFGTPRLVQEARLGASHPAIFEASGWIRSKGDVPM